jgi:Ca2+/Na+ antiporter
VIEILLLLVESIVAVLKALIGLSIMVDHASDIKTVILCAMLLFFCLSTLVLSILLVVFAIMFIFRIVALQRSISTRMELQPFMAHNSHCYHSTHDTEKLPDL